MVLPRCTVYGSNPLLRRFILALMSVAAILEAYTFSEILEMNDLTEEDALEYLVQHGVVRLPEMRPLEFTP